MSEDIIVSGTIESVTYHNAENGYSVFSVEPDEINVKEITCVGVIPELHTGEHITVTGNYVEHATYGRQLKINSFEKRLPETLVGMEKYLASGVIKGIGSKIAKKIIKKFGEAAFYVIEEKPERLAEIRGISLEKALRISQVFAERQAQRNLIVFLQNYDISQTFAIKIYNRYKDTAIEVIKSNPYRLADDISGLGFKTADKLAFSMGVLKENPNRIKSGVKYILNQAAANGHIYLPKDELIEQTSEILKIPIELLENVLIEMQLDSQIWREKIDGEERAYLPKFYYSENYVAKRLVELSQKNVETAKTKKLLSQINRIESDAGITLDENQKKAALMAATQGLLVITGGPGTGKTTTINAIIKLFEKQSLNILLAAPTGRAAKRMSEATGKRAQTIHRMLGISFLSDDGRQQNFEYNETNPLDADAIIIDEMSMVDILLMNSFLKAVSNEARLILVGDVDQLPSVGAGNVLKDIIASEKINVARLDKIFRQAQESAIIMNAHRINRGENPVFNEKNTDFFFMRKTNGDDVVSTIEQLVKTRLPRFLNCDALDDIQVLAPMKKTPTGVYNLNSALQAALNPFDPKKNEKEIRGVIFREGDKVMQIKNNYNAVWKTYDKRGRVVDDGAGIFNGDQGRIYAINNQDENIVVAFDENKFVTYDFTQLDELELAYAITIHKSQGSEYPAVVMPVYNGPPMLMTRNLLYTGVTRAKKMVVLVGSKQTIYSMVENKREINRYSTLAYRIRQMYDFIKKDD